MHIYVIDINFEDVNNNILINIMWHLLSHCVKYIVW